MAIIIKIDDMVEERPRSESGLRFFGFTLEMAVATSFLD